MEPQQKFNKPKRKKGITKPEYKDLNPFKAEEKRYKLYHGQVTDYSGLFQPKQEDWMVVDGYKVCELPFPKGSYYVKNFNSPETVLQIGISGLNTYCHQPYRTNLDSPNQLYQQKTVKQKYSPQIEQKQQKQQKQIEENNNQLMSKGYIFNDKIRWANVGYQYDWTLRKYPDKKTLMHQSIKNISDRANKFFNSFIKDNRCYEPQSAIINYYGIKDYMTGHLDDAEIDQQSPIYSFSFGLSCVFLIGGQTREQKPTAVRLNSGDLLIMSGQARKCYHGVPRVISQTFQSIEQQKQPDFMKEQWKNRIKETNRYFHSHRININIRQVFPKQKGNNKQQEQQ